MASTYTDAGLELIGVGEQSNTWGQTTNTNWRLAEELATGVASVSLNNLTNYTLTTIDGATSNGRHFVVEFTGSPGATSTVTVSPADMQKVYILNNATDQTVNITQGSGGSVAVPAGAKKIVYCDGGGTGASVTDVTENLSLSGEVNVTIFKINGTEVTATADELNVLNGITASTAEINLLGGLTASASEINVLGGFTGSADDLNYAKNLRATGVTPTEFGKLDGLSASTSELNTAASHYVPSGGIIMWSGATTAVPTGWALCDGTNGTPDLRNRFVVGAGSSYSPNNTGGASSVTLTENEMPSHDHSMSNSGNHSHSGSTNTTGNHSHNLIGTKQNGNITSSSYLATDSAYNTYTITTSSGGSHSHSLSINSNGNHSHNIYNTGGGNSHENRPPYYALAYIMKT